MPPLRLSALLLAVLALALTAAEPAVAPDPLAWPAVTAECRPWTRWWWLGSAVDKPNLTRSLEEFKQAGIGGVEITPIYGANGAEGKFIDFLSPQWMDMLAHTTAEAKRLGLGVDMATGTGWPFGGPHVSAEDASARLNMHKYDLAGGDALKAALPRGRLLCLSVVSDAGDRLDLTTKVTGGRLDWVAPPGKWRLYAVALDGPVMKVKRAAPGGVGNVLDPFSVPALNRYLADFDRAFAGFRGQLPRGQFHDSYEYYNAQGTPDLFREFVARRGYDLRTQLPALFGDGSADTVARVKCDYRETLSDLHLAYIRRWTEWCHAHGMISRNQAHGGPGNLLDTYAGADIPEMEIYNRYGEHQMPMMKLAASAAHLSGRNLVSSESFTWLKEHFQASLADVKSAADFLFLSGINHVFFHGIPYSPQDAPWPGWQFYASVNFGPQGGLWHDLPAFNAYIARCQSVLQAGKPANDVLLYLSYHERWQRPDGLVMVSETAGGWMESHPVYAPAMTLWQQGYQFDLASDHLLAKATVDDHDVVIGSSRYRIVVVPPCRIMQPATLRKFLELAKGGATVIMQGALPADVPGLGNLAKRQAELKELRDVIENAASVNAGNNFGRYGPVGIGKVYVGGKLDAVIRGFVAGRPLVAREVMADRGLRVIRRAAPDGYWYFIVNHGERPVDGRVPIASLSASAIVMDPLADCRFGKAVVEYPVDTDNEVYLQLQPGESLVVRTYHTLDVQAPPWRYIKPAGEPLAVAGTWQVQFIDGGPAPPNSFTTRQLGSWTTRDDDEVKRFAGTARYSIEFDRPAGTANDWQLDLGRVCESARVRINGRDVGMLFCPPFRVAVGEHLRPGRNTLEVEVTNLAANRVRDLDRRKVNWKYFYDANLASHPSSRQRGGLDASNWPVRDSGLLGPVTLVPVKYFSPAQERNAK
jgi:hypothetical protein